MARCAVLALVNLLHPHSVGRADAGISWQGDDAGLEQHELASNPGTRCLQAYHRLRRVPRGASRHRLPTDAAWQRARRAVAGLALGVLLARRPDVSSPHRYCRNERRARDRPRDRVSSPHRYCRNASCDRRSRVARTVEFQALIGTVETIARLVAIAHRPRVSSPHRYCRNTRACSASQRARRDRGFKPS
jgi:hypothetical protein